MREIEIKSNLHKIIDKIQNEELLLTLYEFLKSRVNSKPGKLWNSLTDEQKNELLIAIEESEDDKNLIEGDKLFKKNK